MHKLYLETFNKKSPLYEKKLAVYLVSCRGLTQRPISYDVYEKQHILLNNGRMNIERLRPGTTSDRELRYIFGKTTGRYGKRDDRKGWVSDTPYIERLFREERPIREVVEENIHDIMASKLDKRDEDKRRSELGFFGRIKDNLEFVKNKVPNIFGTTQEIHKIPEPKGVTVIEDGHDSDWVYDGSSDEEDDVMSGGKNPKRKSKRKSKRKPTRKSKHKSKRKTTRKTKRKSKRKPKRKTTRKSRRKSIRKKTIKK